MGAITYSLKDWTSHWLVEKLIVNSLNFLSSLYILCDVGTAHVSSSLWMYNSESHFRWTQWLCYFWWQNKIHLPFLREHTAFFTSGHPPYFLSSVRYQCNFNMMLLMLNETFTDWGSPGLVLQICFLINCPFWYLQCYVRSSI